MEISTPNLLALGFLVIGALVGFNWSVRSIVSTWKVETDNIRRTVSMNQLNSVLKADGAVIQNAAEFSTVEDAVQVQRRSNLDSNGLESEGTGPAWETLESQCKVQTTTFSVDEDGKTWHINLDTPKGMTFLTIEKDGRVTSLDASNFDSNFENNRMFRSLWFDIHVDYVSKQSRVKSQESWGSAAVHWGKAAFSHGHARYGLRKTELIDHWVVKKLKPSGNYTGKSVEELLKEQENDKDKNVHDGAPRLFLWNFERFERLQNPRFPDYVTSCQLKFEKTKCKNMPDFPKEFCEFPKGLSNSPDTTCDGVDCTEDECCYDAGTCAKEFAKCEVGSTDESWLPNRTRTGFCQKGTGQCKQSECCERPDKCDASKCPKGMKLRQTTPTWCEDYECKLEECCEPGCSADFRCPPKQINLGERAKSCKGPQCTEEECCKGQCSTITCPETKFPKQNFRKIFCKNSVCEEDECCDDAGSCDSVPECPQEFPGMRRLQYCAKEKCVDQTDCCKAKTWEEVCKEVVPNSVARDKGDGCKCPKWPLTRQPLEGTNCTLATGISKWKFDPKVIITKKLTCTCR